MRKVIGWGIIALCVIGSIWGLCEGKGHVPFVMMIYSLFGIAFLEQPKERRDDDVLRR